MGVLYFTMLLFELLPFCYMSFYVWDRTFFLSDRASGLYSTSAYYAAHMTASETFPTMTLYKMMEQWRSSILTLNALSVQRACMCPGRDESRWTDVPGALLILIFQVIPKLPKRL